MKRSKARPAQTPRHADPARAAAARALSRVLDERLPLDAALAVAGRLETRDRAFARALVSTTLRRLGRIDAALEAFLDRPLASAAPGPRALLRIGAAQLLFLGTPAYAAVDAMTTLAAERPETARAKGLVNAVLRRVAEGGGEVIAGLGPLDDWPRWLSQSWVRAYGAELAGRIAEASGAEAPLDVSVADSSQISLVADRLGGRILPTNTVRRPAGGDVSELPGFAEGGWWVQDNAAAIPAALLGSVAGLRVADLCAAPGGKTLQLAAAGAHVTAVDRAEGRLGRLHENLARTGLCAEVIAADATRFEAAPFDAVLLDAPCTSTGTLRRRPDAAWSKTANDVSTLARIQVALLKNAARLAKPGGRIVYCTCSLQPEEGEGVVKTALSQGVEADIEPVSEAELPGLAEALRPDGTVRVLPCHWAEIGGLDGFFIARLRRR